MDNLILFTEAYRSGHNEAVLKTVCLRGHGGSNPSASAKKHGIRFVFRVFLVVDMGCGLNERSEVEVRGRIATKGAT